VLDHLKMLQHSVRTIIKQMTTFLILPPSLSVTTCGRLEQSLGIWDWSILLC